MSQIAKTEPAPVVPAKSEVLSPLVQAAMSGQLDTEKMRELLSIQKEYEANEARKSYHRAVAEFKANAPTVKKDKTVSFGNTHYKHVSLGYALSEINPVLSQYGLSLSWKTRQEDKTIFVKCILTHELGHSEETELFGFPDNSGQKNPVQQVASTVTYLKRHTAFALLGLEAEDDDDGRGAASNGFITGEQAEILERLLTETDAKRAEFFKLFKATNLEDFPAASFDAAKKALEAKKRKQG